ncbi:hypothetical protein L6R50_16205 [Myxococcota bacterium]|nr:hypothetical protein [Myxococcota bacterium]
MSRKSPIASAAVLALATLLPHAASAFQQLNAGEGPLTWPGGEYGVTIHHAPDVGDVPSVLDAIQGAFDRFALNPATIWFALSPDDDEEQVSGNGENELALTTDAAILGGHPAITLYWYLGTDLIETDVYIDSAVAWTVRDAKITMIHYGGGGRPLDAVVMHELGHCAGLGHEDGLYSLMGVDWTHSIANGMRAIPHIGSDTAAGLLASYGAAGGYDDISITHWEYLEPWGEYAAAQRTEVTDLYGAPVATRMLYGEPVFDVRRGRTYLFDFTLENAGAVPVAVQSAVMLSRDPSITLWDRRIGEAPVYADAGYLMTETWGITIPSDASTGLQYVGVVLDSEGELAEVEEGDNATYIAVRVTP